MKKNPVDIKEFNVNMCDCDDMVSVTAYQRKFINRLNELAEKHPDEVRIVAKNENGTAVYCLPKKYVHISFGERAKREVTDEQREAAAERLRIAREKKAGSDE